MPTPLKRFHYEKLNAREKEAFNFQKVSGVLADYGFLTIRLSNDWGGADFIAQHVDGTFLKVQLKARLTFGKKYEGRDIHECFHDRGQWYLFPHDELLRQVLEETTIARTVSWSKRGGYSFPHLSKTIRRLLDPYRLEER